MCNFDPQYCSRSIWSGMSERLIVGGRITNGNENGRLLWTFQNGPIDDIMFIMIKKVHMSAFLLPPHQHKKVLNIKSFLTAMRECNGFSKKKWTNLNKVKNVKISSMLASKWNCLEVNREEVLTEYSYLSNIGKSSVILSSYIKLVSLLFNCIYLQNAVQLRCP